MRRTQLTIPIPSPTPTTSIPTQSPNSNPAPTPPQPHSYSTSYSGPEACAPCATVRPTGRYDVGSAGTPEALRKQLLALQKQPAAMRALRDAMLLEGKVTQSD